MTAHIGSLIRVLKQIRHLEERIQLSQIELEQCIDKRDNLLSMIASEDQDEPKNEPIHGMDLTKIRDMDLSLSMKQLKDISDALNREWVEGLNKRSSK